MKRLSAIFALILLFRMMIKTKFWVKLTSPEIQSNEDGYNSSLGLEYLIGEIGLATSDLRPSGWVLVNNTKILSIN